MSKSREKTIELLNDNQRKLEELGGPINPAYLLDPQPSENILIRAMLEILISRLSDKLYGG